MPWQDCVALCIKAEQCFPYPFGEVSNILTYYSCLIFIHSLLSNSIQIFNMGIYNKTAPMWKKSAGKANYYTTFYSILEIN